MRKLLTALFIFYSVNVNALGFREFNDYKNNNALLESDILRIEELKDADPDQIYVDALASHKLVLANYEKLNSRLKLSGFVRDAFENGWRRTAEKVQGVVALCEGPENIPDKCVFEINKIKNFVNSSSLGMANKESISLFFDNYISEMESLKVFDNRFISAFNENAKLMNEKIESASNLPKMIVKVNPVVKKTSPIIIKKKEALYSVNQLFFLGSFIFFMASLHFYNGRRKLNYYKRFFAKIFKASRRSKVKLKLIGHLDFKVLPIVRKIDSVFLDALSDLFPAAKENHISFNCRENVLIIESQFHTNRSLQNFIDNQSKVFKSKWEKLLHVVEENGGELVLATRFDNKGDIVKSSLTLNLPIK